MRGLTGCLGLSAVLGAALTLGACASGPPATAAAAALGSAGEAINHARADNGLAAAPDIVAEAQQKLAQARTAAQNGDNAAAIRLANEAKADADLADATAQAARAREAASAANSGNTMLNALPNR
jgi:hypothetical protein